MPGRNHTIEGRAQLEARARAMRVAGDDMQTIAVATGVSTTTLHKWARENMWRLSDIASEASNPDSGACTREGGCQDDDCLSGIAPLSAAEAAAHAQAIAAAELVAGNIVRADRAARLALKFKALIPRQARPAPDNATGPGTDTATGPGDIASSGELAAEDPREILFQRLEKLGEAHWRNHPDPPDWARRQYNLPPRGVPDAPAADPAADPPPGPQS